MTLEESIELRQIKNLVARCHATRADIERAREILGETGTARERFDAAVAASFAAKAGSDRTASERKARQRERENAFMISPEPLDADRREDCRLDLPLFGVTYCGHLLSHAPSQLMVDSLIRPLQNVILYGGQQVVEFPRGAGKTTWMKIAQIWAVVYGHKKFVVTVAATRGFADNILQQVVESFEKSRPIREDFPALAVPICVLKRNWRKASTQKYEGRSTMLSWSGGYFTLPTIYKIGTDEPMEAACGSVFYSAGIHGAIRGLGRDNKRPDMIFFDDPQTREEALSVSSADKLESLIVSDAMSCFGNTDVVAAIMAVTPIRLGDVASRFASRKLHPEWGCSKQPYIVAKSANFDAWLPVFREAYNEDVAISDAATSRGETVTASDKWALSDAVYRDHREEFEGTVVIDPLNYAPGEADAVHHLLKIICRFSDVSDFEAEYQMDVASSGAGEALTPEEVQSRLSGYAACVLPPGTFDCVAFCDVNIARRAGLRWGVMAVGPHRVASMVAYGSYPEDGSALVPPKTAPDARRALVAAGIAQVVRKILTLPLRLDATGERVVPRALCFDGGYETETVDLSVRRVAKLVNLHGMELMMSLGRGWANFRKLKRSKAEEEQEMLVKDHVYSGVTIVRKNGRATTRKYLCIQTDYWREIAHASFTQSPFTAGSCCLFGSVASVHREFALETTYEQLVRTYRDDKTHRQAWEWNNEKPGHNHYGDVLVGCFALAAWKDLYKASRKPSDTAPRVAGKKVEWLADAEARELAKARPRPAAKKGVSSRPSLFRKIKRPKAVR